VSDWCILRTAPSRTITLAKALDDAGFGAWTPSELVVVRNGPTRKREERAVPITPTFVFAPYDRLGDLRALVQSPSQTWLAWDPELQRMVMRGIPYFTLFRFDGRFPAIADRALAPLRLIERRRAPRVLPTVFHAGQQVRVADGGFEGLTGTVEGSKGRLVEVTFPGFPIAVQIDPRHLLTPSAAA